MSLYDYDYSISVLVRSFVCLFFNKLLIFIFLNYVFIVFEHSEDWRLRFNLKFIVNNNWTYQRYQLLCKIA